MTSTILPGGVRVIDDLHLGEPHIIATYLLPGDEPAIVDPGPASDLPHLEAGLAAHGLAAGDLHAILLTHIHLDHAGATGTLVARYPHLRVYVHQRGAPHLAAPERLIRSATRLYGDAMQQLWGEILPVPAENITTLDGGETLALGRRRLRVFDAPGHALHHVVYFDDASGLLFAGDNAGVRMPGHAYVHPPTVPPEFDLEAWGRTLDLIGSLDPAWLLLTHFGPYADVAAHLAALRERLARWTEAVRAGLARGDDTAALNRQMRELAVAEIGPDPLAQASYERAASVELSVAGLVRYLQTRQGAG
jgi:glyoxylase-like metal-dependent hydrolase (beta-lactamase superfamily II)